MGSPKIKKDLLRIKKKKINKIQKLKIYKISRKLKKIYYLLPKTRQSFLIYLKLFLF